MKCLLGLISIGVLHAATLTISIPAFTGCADQFRCQYSGFSGALDSQPGQAVTCDLGTMVFSYIPSPSPDQHAFYSFGYSVNGLAAFGTMQYSANIAGPATFWFVFQGAPGGDPHLTLSMGAISGPVDGRTRIPLSVAVGDSHEAPIHAAEVPEPLAWALMLLGCITLVAWRRAWQYDGVVKTLSVVTLLILMAVCSYAQPTIAPQPDNGPYLNVSSTGTTNFYIFAAPTSWPNNSPSIFIAKENFYVTTAVPPGCSVGEPNPFPVGAQFVLLSCTNTPPGSYSFGLLTYDNSGLRGTGRNFTIVSN